MGSILWSTTWEDFYFARGQAGSKNTKSLNPRGNTLMNLKEVPFIRNLGHFGWKTRAETEKKGTKTPIQQRQTQESTPKPINISIPDA